jgi:archaemetzincin
MRDGIRIQPVGAVPNSLLLAVARALRSSYPRTPISIAGRRWRLPTHAYRPRREQYRADLLLDWVCQRHDGAEAIVAIADADIYEPGYNFLFGLSYIGAGCALVALGHLGHYDSGAPVTSPRLGHRAAMIAIHELGHAYGLDHCKHRGCVMRYEDRIGPVDRERGQFCADCRSHLLA